MAGCFVCSRYNLHKHFENIETCCVPTSKKPIKAVLLHLAKFMKNGCELKLPPDACVCPNCLKELVEYDEFVIKLLAMQQRLTQMIEKTLDRRSHGRIQNSSLYNCTGADNTTTVDDDDDDKEFIALDDTKEISSIIDSLGEEEEISLPDIDDNKVDNEEDNCELLVEFDEEDLPLSQRLTTKYGCPQCTKRFRSKIHLMQHIQNGHKRIVSQCRCNVCGHSVKDEEYLELHMNIHEGKTENECRYCSKRYTRKVNVIRHMQKHWDKKKFQCEKCGLRFSESMVLYNHKLQHEAEEDPLICAVCNQVFKTKRTYKSHIMTHRKDRPRFNCTYCTKSFVEKYTLKVHLRTHEVNATAASEVAKNSITFASDEHKCLYNCIICGSAFSNKDQYNQHMENQHDVIS